jgi:shikimate dehydrogenase
VLHRAAYAELGLDWTYDAYELAAADLPTFLDGLDERWRGLSLTMPLKRAVLPLLDVVTDRAAQAAAANTLVLAGGRRTGHNTDVPGAVAAIRERYDGPLDRAVILGGGATATSTMLALADLGCADVTLMVRDPTRATEVLAAAARHPGRPAVTVRRLADGPVDTDALVSTIPASAQDAAALALAEPAGMVFDVVYDPWPTPLAAFAQTSGRVLVAGLDLLVHQAVLQVELMTGRSGVSVDLLRAAGREALAARG